MLFYHYKDIVLSFLSSS
uniref:Uncharacterized protein n=1 Tax=Rhizophora mucronata TaxID=61149 RepID=A0A2P2PFE6_RHIMU